MAQAPQSVLCGRWHWSVPDLTCPLGLRRRPAFSDFGPAYVSSYAQNLAMPQGKL